MVARIAAQVLRCVAEPASLPISLNCLVSSRVLRAWSSMPWHLKGVRNMIHGVAGLEFLIENDLFLRGSLISSVESEFWMFLHLRMQLLVADRSCWKTEQVPSLGSDPLATHWDLGQSPKIGCPHFHGGFEGAPGVNGFLTSEGTPCRWGVEGASHVPTA